jgi:hypothetical protein
VLGPLTITSKSYIPKEPFLDQAFTYGLRRTPDKERYQQELYSVDEQKAFYKLALSKTAPAANNRLGQIQFRGNNTQYIQSRTT